MDEHDELRANNGPPTSQVVSEVTWQSREVKIDSVRNPTGVPPPEEQPFLPKNPPASMEAIDRKRSFLKHSKPTDYKRKPPRHPSTVE